MSKRTSYKFDSEVLDLLQKLSKKKEISMTKVIERLILKESVKEGLID